MYVILTGRKKKKNIKKINRVTIEIHYNIIIIIIVNVINVHTNILITREYAYVIIYTAMI